MSDYATNCPNCGAPLTSYGRCEYCGTIIDRPVQFLALRPGMKKIVCKATLPYELGAIKPNVAAEYAKRGIQDKISAALADSIKLVVRSEFDPVHFQEVISVRGELWVGDPDVRY
jgi:hypothetical protein